jgi:hypothetical protein
VAAGAPGVTGGAAADMRVAPRYAMLMMVSSVSSSGQALGS